MPILAIKRLAHHHRDRDRVVHEVVVGMWLERFLIVVPALGHKFLPYSWGDLPAYLGGSHPDGVQFRHGMALLYLLFFKIRPHDFHLGDEGRAPASRRSASSCFCRWQA